MKEIKERVTDELLPKAFSIYRDTRVWIDTVNHWLVIDAAASAKADEVIGLLVKTIDPLPLDNLYVEQSPAAAMTGYGWRPTKRPPTSRSTRIRSCAPPAKAAPRSATSSTRSTSTMCGAISSPASNARAWR